MNQSIVKYPHPSRLSDPYGDFDEAELSALVLKKDSELDGTDLMQIFQSHLPAGRYEECADYLPIAVNYIKSESLDYVDVCKGLLHWISDYRSSLEKDGMFDVAQNELIDFFCKDINEFSVCDGYPYHVGIIHIMLEVWNSLDNYNNLGDELLNKIFPPVSTYHQAAWTCYLLYEHYSYYSEDGYSKIIPLWSRDDALKKNIRDVILDYTLEEDELVMFWDKILILCGMM